MYSAQCHKPFNCALKGEKSIAAVAIDVAQRIDMDQRLLQIMSYIQQACYIRVT